MEEDSISMEEMQKFRNLYNYTISTLNFNQTWKKSTFTGLCFIYIFTFLFSENR